MRMSRRMPPTSCKYQKGECIVVPVREEDCLRFARLKKICNEAPTHEVARAHSDHPSHRLTCCPWGRSESSGSIGWRCSSPAIMALAVISTAFTGQAIAVAFDRRYGALKRLGATALPVWGIIAGKALAVVSVVFLQAILLGGIGLALGWRPDPAGLALGAVIIALGTATFVAMGLLLGGTLRAEIVLALANLLWFVFAGIGALTLESGIVPKAVSWVARRLPVRRADRGTLAGDPAFCRLVGHRGVGGLGCNIGRGGDALVPVHLRHLACRGR